MRKVISIFSFSFLCLLIPLISSASISAEKVSGVLFSLDKLDTDKFYYCNINDSVYYIKFDKISDDYAEGKYFILNKLVFADLKPFQVNKKRKSYLVKFDDQTVEVKPDFVVGSKSIVGKYGINRKFLKIFRNYKWSEYLEIKIHEPSTAPRYPLRYIEEVFDDVIVKPDIVYGTAEGYWDSYPLDDESYIEILKNGVLSSISKKDLNLKMDIYMPEGDDLEKRPLLMLMHGGGFYIGDKKTTAMVEWCKYFAKMGYVTASVNYRLGFKPVGPSIQRAGYRGLQDAHAAMRFIVSKADEFGIDTDMIFVGGTSAGGVTALNLTYMRNKNRPDATKKSLLYSDQGDIEKSGNQLKNKFEIKAVVNMWGAVNDLEVLKNSKVPVTTIPIDMD